MLVALGCVALLVAVVVYFATRSPSTPKSQFTVLSPGSAKGGNNAAASASSPALTGPELVIYYGTQTGTAEGFARKLSEEFRNRTFNTRIIDLEEFDADLFVTHKDILMVIASYGEGEPTDSSRKFYKWLEDKEGALENNLLSGMNFFVFGLGNRQYEHYQAMGRFVDKRFEALGAHRIMERGEGDDDGTMEDDFAAWKENMWPQVLDFYGVEVGNVSDVHKFQYNVTWVDSSDDVARAPRKSISHMDSHPLHHVTVTRNDELHSSLSDRSCRHVELDLSSSPSLSYETGDHVAIYPHNDDKLVDGIAKRLNVDPSREFSLVNGEGASLFPGGVCSVRTALTQFVEVNSIKKGILPTLASFATNEEEAKKIEHLGSRKGKAEFEEYATKSMRNILDLLNDYPSISIPIEKFFELIPRMQPRYYSIASSSSVHPRSIHVAASVERVVFAADKREFNGVCTSYLARLRVGAIVDVFVRKSTFKLPRDISNPKIMIGPGTGFAPIRGFMQELKLANEEKKPIGKNILFFGCQNRQHDFIYENEIMDAQREGVFWRTHFAFSREQSQKVYVQHKIAEEAETLLPLLKSENGFLYICGSLKMAKDVKAAIAAAAVKMFGWSQTQAEDWLHTLQNTSRFHQDVW